MFFYSLLAKYIRLWEDFSIFKEMDRPEVSKITWLDYKHIHCSKLVQWQLKWAHLNTHDLRYSSLNSSN